MTDQSVEPMPIDRQYLVWVEYSQLEEIIGLYDLPHCPQ